MLAQIEALETIRASCEAGAHLDRELQKWLGEVLGKFLDHTCEDLDEAFGLVQEHGGVPWWMERAIRVRDAELRALAQLFPGDMTLSRRARRVKEMSDRYGAICWPRDRRLAEMPEQYRGTAKAHLWRAFRSGAKMPVSERRLRSVLA